MIRRSCRNVIGRKLAPSALVLGLVLIPLLTGGGISGARAAQDKPTITQWFETSFGAETPECLVKNVVDPFNAKGGVQVKATLQANNWDKTRTELAGGGGPDLIGTPGPSFAVELAKAGQLLPLDEFSTKFNWPESFIPWALDLGKVDGKLYSLPNEVETPVLYYNKTLFEKNGWQPPKTLDELKALAKTIDDAGVIPFAHANNEWRPANEWFVGEFLNHAAGPDKVYQALTGKLKWTDPAFVDAINRLDEMQKNGWFMGGLDRYYTTKFDDSHAALGDGDAAMNIEGSWFLNDIDQFFGKEAGNDNEWAWVPMPSMDGTAIFDLGIGSTTSINKNTKNPDAVAEYLNYLYSPEIQATMRTKCGVATAPVKIPAEALKGLDPRVIDILGSVNKAAEANNYGYTTWVFWPPKTETYLIETIEKVWAGDMTAEEYLAGMQKIFDQEVAAHAVPPIPPR